MTVKKSALKTVTASPIMAAISATTTNALSSFAPPVIQTKYNRQELYLNKVDTYIKSVSECKKRVDYMIREGYNGAKTYGIGSLIGNASNWPYIRDFVGMLKQAGVIRVGMAYSDKSSVDKIAAFNAWSGHTINQTQIDNQISEIEPWVKTSGWTWDQFFETLEYVQRISYSAKPRLETLSYEGWPENPTKADELKNTKGTILGVDISCLHVYTYGQPKYSYFRSRLIASASQAVLCGYTALKPLTILPIFSSEKDFSYDYFTKNHPTVAMDAIVAAFNADSFPNKEVLKLNEGFLMFKASDIMDARKIVL